MSDDAIQLNPTETSEFQASPKTEKAGVDLESARLAYQLALENLLNQFPDMRGAQAAVVESLRERVRRRS